jgi:hypothetical protein
MKDLQERLKILRADAADCAYIASVTADKVKEDLFAVLAANMSELAEQVEDLISAKLAKGDCEQQSHGADTRPLPHFKAAEPILVRPFWGQKMDDEASILMRRSQSCRRMAERMDDPEAAADLLRLAKEYELRANAWFEADERER